MRLRAAHFVVKKPRCEHMRVPRLARRRRPVLGLKLVEPGALEAYLPSPVQPGELRGRRLFAGGLSFPKEALPHPGPVLHSAAWRDDGPGRPPVGDAFLADLYHV